MATADSSIATNPHAALPSEPVDVHARIGSTVAGRYKVISLLGEGGMGAVYLVEHTQIRKRMALKVLSHEMMQNPEMVTRFEREALAAAHLEHVNVVAASDLGRTEDGALFLVLEYIDGQNLRDVLGFGALPPARVLHIARQITSALIRAHAVGIVHRDLKPENIMLQQRDESLDLVKILDFGLAKVRVEALLSSDQDAARSEVLTRYGTVFGTPAYMAPEQAVGAEVDGRTDLYALGVIMYELLTGYVPFESEDPSELLKFHITMKVPAMAERSPGVRVPAAIEQLVLRLLEKRPDKRMQDARLTQEAIDQVAVSEGLRFEPSMSMHRGAMPVGVIPKEEEPAAESSDAGHKPTVVGPGGVDVYGNTQPKSSGGSAAVGNGSVALGLAAEPGIQLVNAEATTADGAATAEVESKGTGANPALPKLRAPSMVNLAMLKPDTANPELLAPAPPPTAGERARELAKQAWIWICTVAFPALLRAGNWTWQKTKIYVPKAWNGLLNFIRPRLPQKWRSVSQLGLGMAVAALLAIPLTIAMFVWLSSDEPSVPSAVPTAGFATDKEMERGVEDGVSTLESLLAKYPKDARIHKALIRAHTQRKNYSAALRILAPLLQLDPITKSDPQIGQMLAAAVLVPDTSDTALQFLEMAMGESGVDLLLDLAERTTMEPWRTKLNQSLTKESVRAQASPESLLLLDLQSAPRCETKRDLLPRATQSGGPRVLAYLQKMQLTTGCGPGGQVDCYPCLRKGNTLQKSITTLSTRLNSGK